MYKNMEKQKRVMKTYKGIPYLIASTNTEFTIFFDVGDNLKFKAMYGNKVLYCTPKEAKQILIKKIRYLINKRLKEKKK